MPRELTPAQKQVLASNKFQKGKSPNPGGKRKEDIFRDAVREFMSDKETLKDGKRMQRLQITLNTLFNAGLRGEYNVLLKLLEYCLVKPKPEEVTPVGSNVIYQIFTGVPQSTVPLPDEPPRDVTPEPQPPGAPAPEPLQLATSLPFGTEPIQDPTPAPQPPTTTNIEAPPPQPESQPQEEFDPFRQLQRN